MEVIPPGERPLEWKPSTKVLWESIDGQFFVGEVTACGWYNIAPPGTPTVQAHIVTVRYADGTRRQYSSWHVARAEKRDHLTRPPPAHLQRYPD